MFKRSPDFVVGSEENPYMLRWYLVPRNRWFNVYLHKFLRSDDDRAMHDHPWWSVSFILSGRYVNVTPEGRRLRRRFSVMFMKAMDIHRVELIEGKPVWTLFITRSGMPGNEIGRGCD